ncbi:hypothetical protein AZF04_05420 [Alkalihalobacillus trypoxylicola]|uniref:Uncharacterized protein n=1 Tax=Alkalihalobacillus trypoxylicola TaxID=519424 RepID=A0A161PG89_9BACI|nr:hypothetical protein AZF04_05420 [Alkalihalobacillus trypoxylicola]
MKSYSKYFYKQLFKLLYVKNNAVVRGIGLFSFLRSIMLQYWYEIRKRIGAIEFEQAHFN